MDSRKIRYINSEGQEHTETIQIAPLKCPHCKISIIPKYIYANNGSDGNISVFCQCTNPGCNKTFLAKYVQKSYVSEFSSIQANSSMDKKDFSDIVRNISPSFCDIYNQAYAAQQMNLSQICGVGYRKALEFLIKDYIMSGIEDDKKDGIKQKNLAKCIKEDISSPNVKAVAARATWIGNDETHYIRKWEDKDIKDLIGMIDLTIRWIESEVETKRLLEEMPMP